MESIHHFSHSYHPLFLKKFGENEEEKEFVCDGCGEQITEKDNYYACQVCEEQLFLKKLMKLGEICENKEFGCYGCGEQITEKDNYYACQECSYFHLHKKCADLPREIHLPCHQHPLTLFDSSPYGGSCECNICQRKDWYWFTYHCSLCKFDIDVICSSLLLEGKMEIIHHFSHYDEHHFSHSYHPLFLKKFGENEEEKEFVCFGCQEQITEKDNYYACKHKYCSWFYLHKKCADLPREINLPIHQHPLTLFASSPYIHRPVDCYMCQRSGWERFTYHCSLCNFNIDVICSFFLHEGMKNNLQHEAHPHPLTLNIRPSLFRCDACKTEDKDLSYFCNPCNFWIHKSCAYAPKSFKFDHHDDPLFLAYSLPEQHRNFPQYCDICKKEVIPSNWVYYCDDCRYFNHLKCATSNPPRLTKGESEIQDEDADTESSQLMQFPFPNRESVPDSLSLFVANKNASVAYDDGPTEISHWLHHHPISIFTTKNVAYNDMICDGCVRPISAPFYSCSSKCNFFLHKFCAELPEELQCPLDSAHSIKVKKNKCCDDYFKCSFCLRYCTGFLCECVSCNLKLDIGCASNLIPSRIKHDSHGQHPLVRSYSPIPDRNFICNACNTYTDDGCVYSCKACSFNLCMKCVNYPGLVRHEYDRHSIPLTYPPIKDHPSDFICEICEEDINPRDWMYHCKDCNQSFHTECLSPFDEYSNVKFGGKVNIHKIHTSFAYLVQKNLRHKAIK